MFDVYFSIGDGGGRWMGVNVFLGRRARVGLIFPRTAQARNQDFMWGGANEAKVDQTTEIYFLLSIRL